MATLTWTHGAVASLHEIFEHIARDRPATARRTIESIVAKARSLADEPRLGQPYPHRADPTLRHLAYGGFRIAYRLEASGGIAVLGVFHGLIFLPLG